jgi:hypothetical protein
MLLLAAVLNIGTVYFAKASEGMTRLRESWSQSF